MEENNQTVESEYEWENQAANISHHVKTSNKKKKEDFEVLVNNKTLDLDGVRVLTEKTMRSETTTTSKVVLPPIYNNTIENSSVKTNATNHRLTTEETAFAKMATDNTATINPTSTPPASTGKSGSLKASLRLEATNSTEALGYWDLLQSWLPQVWK